MLWRGVSFHGQGAGGETAAWVARMRVRFVVSSPHQPVLRGGPRSQLCERRLRRHYEAPADVCTHELRFKYV